MVEKAIGTSSTDIEDSKMTLAGILVAAGISGLQSGHGRNVHAQSECYKEFNLPELTT